MITFFELTDQMTRPGQWRVDAISVGKGSIQSMSAITLQFMQQSSNVGLCLFLCGVFEIFPSLINCVVCVHMETYAAYSRLCSKDFLWAGVFAWSVMSSA